VNASSAPIALRAVTSVHPVSSATAPTALRAVTVLSVRTAPRGQTVLHGMIAHRVSSTTGPIPRGARAPRDPATDLTATTARHEILATGPVPRGTRVPRAEIAHRDLTATTVPRVVVTVLTEPTAHTEATAPSVQLTVRPTVTVRSDRTVTRTTTTHLVRTVTTV
jgi:hypothetical protein